ncbi:unnamed protein product, partial [Brassica rapa]
TDVLCVLTDTHGRPVYERPVCVGGHPQTHTDTHAHVVLNHPNSPREGPAC